jgi:hypothetical protein
MHECNVVRLILLVYYKLVVLVNAWEVGRIIYVGSSKIARHGLKSNSMNGASLHKLDVQFYLEVFSVLK